MTAPPAIFHWYLIFAVILLVAWTKIERPAGKVWLAVAAALGLSLGIVFPLATTPGLAALEVPFALASLYLGGAAAGLAYLIFLLAREPDRTNSHGPAKWLAITATIWATFLACALKRTAAPFHLTPAGFWLPLGLAVLLVVLACLIWIGVRRGSKISVRSLAGVAVVAALGANFLAAVAFRSGTLEVALPVR